MSKINPKKAFASEIFDGFGGIEADQPFGKSGMLSMRNFRILSDGSIQKRCGWRMEAEFDAPVRGYWSGTLDGNALCFAAAGSHIYQLKDGGKQSVCAIKSATEKVRFFTYRGFLYALDGNDILRYDPKNQTFISASGYVPLFGTKWHPVTMGFMNEPINLLNNRIRLHYDNSIGATEFLLPFYVSSVDQVRLGTKLTTDYELGATKDRFTVNEVASSVEVSCTVYLDSENANILRASPCASAHRDGTSERLLLYGSTNSNLLFCANEVDPHEFLFSKSVYPDSDPLYFPDTSALLLGDEEHPITSVCRHRERFLAFHKDGAYSISISESGKNAEAYPLLQGMGCRAVDAIMHLDGDPVVINSSGVFVLRASASDDDDFRCECLSESVPALRVEDFADRVITAEDLTHGELWFAAPESVIYVFNKMNRQWYSFQGINPSVLLPDGDRVGFGAGQILGFFDETVHTDNGEYIIANFQTGYLPFGHPELLKRTLRISLCADPSARATVEISTEHKSTRFTLDATTSSQFPAVFDHRLSIGRFRLLRVSLNDSLGINSRYYRLALFANV